MQKPDKISREERRKRLAELFLAFFKIGAFTFGGGYAMIPMIQKETAEKRSWISDSDILEITAIAESTPGPIAVNSATFVGYKTAGFAGAFCATLGVVLPSFIIIFALSRFLRGFQDIEAVRYAFIGIRAGVLSLVIKALVSMYKQCRKDLFAHSLMLLAFVLTAFFDVGVIFVILICAACGLVFSLYGRKARE